MLQILLSVRESATALGVSRTTVFNLIRSGHLRAVRLHGRTLIARSELERFAASLPYRDADEGGPINTSAKAQEVAHDA